jgi:hypothetical protein
MPDLRKRPEQTRAEFIAEVVASAPPLTPEAGERLRYLLPAPRNTEPRPDGQVVAAGG